MKTIELRDDIIRKVLKSNDDQLLSYLNQLLNDGNEAETYKLTDFGSSLISPDL